MPRSEERVIGGRTFVVHTLGFEAQRNLMVVIVNALGPGLSGIADGAELTGLAGLAGGIGSVLERLNTAQLDRLQAAFAGRTFVDLGDGKRPLLSDAGLDIVFDDRLADYVLWLKFALEVNYAGFFGAFRLAFANWRDARKAKAAAAGTQSGSQSPATSIGRSTGFSPAADTTSP